MIRVAKNHLPGEVRHTMASGTGAMSEGWEKWEGRVIDGKFPLRRYLSYTDGAVFLTEYSSPEIRKATIKLIPDNTPGGQRRLAQWEMARKLSHPHLLSLFATGRERFGGADFLYVVTEFTDENLGQILPQRALTPAEARDMLQPVLEVLTYLHGEGLVHGELRPANIMAVDDQLKLSSEGIRQAGEKSGEFGSRSVYDAPETASGEKSPAADIWALGVTLVEALTQRSPAIQGSGEAQVPNSLPEPFPDIVRHCLVRDPHRRWTSGAIAAWLRPDTSRPERKETASAGQHSQLGEWRYRILMMAIGFAVVLFVGSRIFKHPTETSTVPASAPTTQTQPAPEAAPPKASQQAQKPSPSAAPAAAAPKARRLSSGEQAPGSVLEQVMPAISKSARDTIQGHFKVDVRVAVDDSGNVKSTKLTSAGPSKYFASKAVDAAKQWKFKAAQENGQNAASAWVLHFEFSKKGTTVHPTPTTH